MNGIFLKVLSLLCCLLVSTIAQAQWVEDLPQAIQDAVLWAADHEEGSLNDWTLEEFEYPGGGIFNTGGNEVNAFASASFSHSGNYSAGAMISNAWQAQNGSRAVRLMRWTDTAWDNGGEYFPKTSYYSAFFYFPNTYNPNKYPPWDPGDGGWWNIFQFKSDDAQEISQPVWTMNVEHDDATQEMSLYLYTKENVPNSVGQTNPLPLPTEQWVHLEALYVASDPNQANGQISIWQDGTLILEAKDVVTTLASGVVVWGIGNYTDHIAGEAVPGTATIYFDDALVSTSAIHPYVSCSNFETIAWSGAGDGASWNDPANWSLGFTPLDCQKVIIPENESVNIVADQNINIKAMEIKPGASLSIHSSATLNLLLK